MPSRKPKNPITKIRTGSGDFGTTYFRGQTNFPKTSAEIEYLGSLDIVQSFLIADLETSYGKFNRFAKLAQDLVFCLGANFNSPGNEKYKAKVIELTEQLEEIIPKLIEDNEPLTGFIRTTVKNKEFRQAGAAVRHSEILYLRIGDTDTDQGKTLNVLSDFLFALAWMETTVSTPSFTYKVEKENLWEG